MKTFDVYAHSSGDTVAVKRGFSWPGLFLGPIWALVKGLILIGCLLLVAVIVLRMLEAAADMSHSPGLMIVVGLLYVIIPLIVGANGNNWRRNKLLALGYNLRGTVEAATPPLAIAKARTSADIKNAIPRDVRERLESMSTDELKEIDQFNKTAWSAEARAVVRELLLERGEISSKPVE